MQLEGWATDMIGNHAEYLGTILRQARWTIAVAESLTGGHLQTLITSVSGSSDYFVGGITAYNIDQKVGRLGVDRDHAHAVDCVSDRVALEMATGVRTLFGSAVGVSTTGYAEPCPEGGIDQPFAFYAFNINGWTTSGRIDAGARSRIAVQEFVARTVLQKLVEACRSVKDGA
jgi:nicotinamide-nucleotide amidase